MSETLKVLISDARTDGQESSIRLRDELKAAGIISWRDERIDPTGDFMGEIETALEAALR